jgi:subtilase family protein
MGMLPRILVMLGLATVAQAQIHLPSLPLPGLPLQNLPGTQTQAGSDSLDHLSGLRQLKIQQLIRANRRTLETDPAGEPVVRSEILALPATEDALARAELRGFVIDRQQAISSANIFLTVLKAPPNVSTKKALRELRDADPQGLYDYNHIFTGGGALPAAPSPTGPASQTEPPAPSALPAETLRPHIRVGLLDTGVDATHPVFHDSVVNTWGCGDKKIPAAHGTAVASILVAHASAELYAADVYCGTPTGGAVDAIVAALGWMVQEQVTVINVSLVGPKNILLERIVTALIARGHVIVAAVGNDGPSAPPLYPAAYAEVVGVTAVDARRRVLIEAERGPQVMFAALGADFKAADIGHGYAAVRGTSFAAPTVAALLAAPLSAPDRNAARAAIEALAKQAINPDRHGRDLTYGFGLVGADGK